MGWVCASYLYTRIFTANCIKRCSDLTLVARDRLEIDRRMSLVPSSVSEIRELSVSDGESSLGGFDGVDHEHRNGQGSDASRDGGIGRSGHGCVNWMDISHQHAALTVERCERVQRVAEDARGLLAVRNAIDSDVHNGGSGPDE